MAQGSTLPPQAYTRETLTTAFNWLQTQPESVRMLATTPDSLVCLYTRAQRSGGASFESFESEAPVSSQNFMSDLKNLAEGLRQFESPSERSDAVRPSPALPRPQHRAPPTPIPALNQAYVQTPVAPTATPTAAPTATPTAAPSSAAAAAPVMPFALNERSWAMVQEVKVAMNLSNDAEAANLMMALAYKSLKSLLA